MSRMGGAKSQDHLAQGHVLQWATAVRMMEGSAEGPKSQGAANTFLTSTHGRR